MFASSKKRIASLPFLMLFSITFTIDGAISVLMMLRFSVIGFRSSTTSLSFASSGIKNILKSVFAVIAIV